MCCNDDVIWSQSLCKSQVVSVHIFQALHLCVCNVYKRDAILAWGVCKSIGWCLQKKKNEPLTPPVSSLHMFQKTTIIPVHKKRLKPSLCPNYRPVVKPLDQNELLQAVNPNLHSFLSFLTHWTHYNRDRSSPVTLNGAMVEWAVFKFLWAHISKALTRITTPTPWGWGGSTRTPVPWLSASLYGIFQLYNRMVTAAQHIAATKLTSALSSAGRPRAHPGP